MIHQILLLAENDPDPATLVDVAKSYVVDNGPTLATNVLLALLIFALGRWAAKILRSVFARALRRARVDETLIKFLGALLYTLLLVVVIMAALERLGVNTTSVAAVLAAAGLAVGLALQNSLSNFAAGVMLVLFRPFQVGDFVEAGGTAGIVDEIHIFNTRMRSGDNKRIIVPNGSIVSGTITNFSAMDTRRIDLVVGCGYNDDLRAVKAFLEELIAGDERILAEPEPLVAVEDLGASSVNFVVRPWTKAADYWPLRRALVERIKLGFDERGFTIPYPSQDIHLHNAN